MTWIFFDDRNHWSHYLQPWNFMVTFIFLCLQKGKREHLEGNPARLQRFKGRRGNVLPWQTLISGGPEDSLLRRGGGDSPLQHLSLPRRRARGVNSSSSSNSCSSRNVLLPLYPKAVVKDPSVLRHYTRQTVLGKPCRGTIKPYWRVLFWSSAA